MLGRVVTLIGAGNVTCAPKVIATVAGLGDEFLVDFRLFDANDERLDLMDRLARVCFDQAKSESTIRSSTDLAELLDGTTDVIIGLGEDCSRRILGATSAPTLDNFEPEADPWELRRGDPNRPTPVDRLSTQTRQMLERPLDMSLGSFEVIQRALSHVVPIIPPSARILSLVQEVALPPILEIETLAWPDPLSESELSLIPHQILRWVVKQEPIHELLDAGKDSPVRTWLFSLPDLD